MLLLLFQEDFIINDNSKKTNRNENEDLVNANIRFPNVLVIDPNGESLGVMPRLRALQLAETYNLDLLCVSKDAKVPVCKILDYGKYRFKQQKKEREAKKNQKIIEIKEIQLSPVIGIHDVETKLKHARRFLEAGNKVKITMRFKGRQLSHIDVGEKVINDFIDQLKEISVVEKPAVLDKRLLTVMLASKIKK